MRNCQISKACCIEQGRRTSHGLEKLVSLSVTCPSHTGCTVTEVHLSFFQLFSSKIHTTSVLVVPGVPAKLTCFIHPAENLGLKGTIRNAILCMSTAYGRGLSNLGLLSIPTQIFYIAIDQGLDGTGA